MRIVLIDNYDSFTYNLVDLLLQQGVELDVVRNTFWNASDFSHDAVLLSPGPCTPVENGRLMDAVEFYSRRQIPMLGVCLGHQAIGQHFGACLKRAQKPMHGKTSVLELQKQSQLWVNIPDSSTVMRYHSLTLENLPNLLVCTAKSNDGEIMAIEHESLPIYGVQFHPESILTNCGAQLIKNFLDISAQWTFRKTIG